MSLELQQVSTVVDGHTHIYQLDMALKPNSLTVLLGATQAGKTSLMRVMAGLDKPSKGRLLFDGEDVTGRSVRERNIAMVYQQFINYPSMSVFDNIASPLKLAGRDTAASITQRVNDMADRLHISQFLQRLPAELSGGQQQRVALARALIKAAPLTLLDEPLVNLDYKLREELREELTAVFDVGNSTIVYATTEPGEALLIPSMWWHHIEALDNFNVLVNYWWRNTPAYMGPPLNVLQHAMMSLRDLPVDQRAVWQQLFDHYVFNPQEEAFAHIPEQVRGVLNPINEASAKQTRTMLLNKLKR